LEEADIIHFLVEEGKADLEAKDNEGYTAFHYAVMSGNEDNVEYFLSKNANPSSKDKYNSAPLHFAAFKGHLAITKLLLSSPNIDINATNSKGETPLHWAVKNEDSLRLVTLLVDKGANAKAKNNLKETPFMVAAEINPESSVTAHLSKITGETCIVREVDEMPDEPTPKTTAAAGAAKAVQRKPPVAAVARKPPVVKQKPKTKRQWKIWGVGGLVVVVILVFLFYR